MAIVYAAANGDWNTPGTWTGGALPGANDIVYANGKTITISSTIANTVDSISNLAVTSPAILAGGVFQFTGTVVSPGILKTNNTTVGANSYSGSGLNGVLTTTTGAYGQFTGNIFSAGNGAGAYFISNNGGNLTLNGNYTLLNLAAATTTTNVIIYITGSGNTTINGNLSSTQSVATSVNRNALWVASGAGNVYVNGYVSPSVQNANVDRTVYLSAGSIFSVNYSGTDNNGYAVAGGSAPAVHVTSASTSVYVTGNVGTAGTNCAIYCSSSSLVSITGNIVASANCGAVSCAGYQGTLIVGGNIISNLTILPYMGFKVIQIATTSTLSVVTSTTILNIFAKSGNASSDLTVNNVRNGVIYGSLTGTMVVPLPANVRVTTPVDVNPTVGTLIMTPFLFWDTLTSTMTTGSSYGERLKVASTVTTDGSQIIAYNI